MSVDGEAYATNKLAAHPDALAKMRATGEGTLLTVHLMPQNVCNHRCTFCAYRMPDNRQSEAFDESQHIAWTDMVALLDDLQTLGVKAVEVTGGGEPLAYPHIVELLRELDRRNFKIGLVTNGTLAQRIDGGYGLARLCAANLQWVRISIDAADAHTYARMRKVPMSQFHRPWELASQLGAMRGIMRPDFRLGLGFVIDNENVGEVYEFVRMAKASGADNVRLSVTFSSQDLDHFQDQGALRMAIAMAEKAERDFDSPAFRVHNQTVRRMEELETPVQDYPSCPTANVLCVVEGAGDVFTCCTFTGSRKGKLGNIRDGFLAVWEGSRAFREGIDPRRYCKLACLYRAKNLEMLRLLGAAEQAPVPAEVLHKDFL